jgi:hypothetical protein
MDFIEIIKKNKESDPEAYEAVYGILVEDEIHTKYQERDIQAIVNNYLDEPDNEKYIQEFKVLQEWRKQCKYKIKKSLGVI